MKKFLRNIRKRIKYIYLYCSLKISNSDNLNYCKKLQKQILLLKSPSILKTTTSSEKSWNEFRLKLRYNILTNNPNDFLNFDVIRYTMFNDAHINEYEYLKNHTNKELWSKLLRENSTGTPPPYRYDYSTSGNLVHTVYNFVQFADKTGIDINKFDKIIEFGGGYGCLCRIIKQYGFKGQYIITDLPEFLFLQEYYLKSSGKINNVIRDYYDNSNTINNVLLLDDFSKLANIKVNPNENILFIATWSFSEIPISLRETVLKQLNRFSLKNYFIAYQKQFEDVNNVKYFADFTNIRQDTKWIKYDIEHLKDNCYLFGQKIEFI